jgi:hypothetical protein
MMADRLTTEDQHALTQIADRLEESIREQVPGILRMRSILTELTLWAEEGELAWEGDYDLNLHRHAGSTDVSVLVHLEGGHSGIGLTVSMSVPLDYFLSRDAREKFWRETLARETKQMENELGSEMQHCVILSKENDPRHPPEKLEMRYNYARDQLNTLRKLMGSEDTMRTCLRALD